MPRDEQSASPRCGHTLARRRPGLDVNVIPLPGFQVFMDDGFHLLGDWVTRSGTPGLQTGLE